MLTVDGQHWICHNLWWHVLPGSTLFRLQGVLQGYCPKWDLHFMHFPGLSLSGSRSWVLRKGTDSVGRAFCALPRSEQLRRPGAWRAHCPRWAVHLNYLPNPSRLVSWEHCKSMFSGVPCVSSGELISGCHPPGLYSVSGKIPLAFVVMLVLWC